MTSVVQPWIRRYNYLSDYYLFMHELYERDFPAYPVTYYSLDHANSVYDEKLQALSYEHHGVGELSGVLWTKNMMVPVHSMDSMTMNMEGGERGVTAKDSLVTKIVLPDVWGIVPREWDFVHFKQDFMLVTDDAPLFVVTQANKSDYGDGGHYEVHLRVTSKRLEDLEAQVSSSYMFVDQTRQLHPIGIANLLLSLQSRSAQIQEVLHESFHEPTGFFLHPDA